MRVLLLCVLLGLVLSGCRKKSAPEFYKLEADQSILVSREGDDAWVSPEMTAIVAGLQAIPQDALEKPRADALAAKIAAEQARVTAERQAGATPPPSPSDPFAGRLGGTEPPAAAAAQPEAAPVDETDGGDRGPNAPWAGMEEKLFVARFGRCFAQGPEATLPGGRPATNYVLVNTAPCQKEFGAPNTIVSYLFTEKRLWGKSSETTRLMDAGTILLPVPAQPPPPPPPPPIIVIPGAPLPPGYETVPRGADAG